jgi:hypothetical protein
MLTNALKKEHFAAVAPQPHNSTPIVSLFMPFEPKMVSKNEIIYKLQSLINEAEQKLIKCFPISAVKPVLERLKSVIKNLDYSTHKKSTAIYVSANAEKLFYLDTLLEEKVTVDTSFNIRALVESKKRLQQHLVLVLGNNISRVYFGNGLHLVSMLTNTCKKSQSDNISSLENFIKETDNNLGIILNYFPLLPLFVVGNARTLNTYKINTKNETHITQLVETSKDEVTVEEVKTELQPYIVNWEYIRMKHLHRRLENAMESDRIAIGLDNVTKAANQRHAKLLIVEKDYTIPVVKAEQDTLMTDAVDEVIERVLSNGGEVAFADKIVLDGYQHIALVY